MKDSIVHFMLFEKSNYLGIEPLLNYLEQHSCLTPKVINGFDFKEHTGQIRPLHISEKHKPDSLENYSVDIKSNINFTRDASVAEQVGLDIALFDSVLGRKYMPELVKEYQKNIAALENYCKIHAPRVVVLAEDTDYIRGRMACHVLRKFECKIIILCANYYNFFIKYPLQGERLGDLYLCATQTMQQRIKECTGTMDKVIYCGSPLLDKLRDHSDRKTENVLLFALQNLPAERELLLEIIQLVRQNFPAMKLIIKPHPEFPLGNDMLDQEGVLVSESNEPIKKLLHKVKAVIGKSSTVLYQAIATGVPVIIPNYDGLPLTIDIPEEISSRSVVQTSGATIELIRSILNGEYTNDPLEWLVPEQPAIPRITEILESQLAL